MRFYFPKYFGEIKVNEVALTTKGQKLFKDGAIPTGVEKERAKDIFFSPVTRKFDVQYNMPPSPLADFCIPPMQKDNARVLCLLNKFVRQVQCRKVERLYLEYAEKPFDDEVGKAVTYAVDSLGCPEYFEKLVKYFWKNYECILYWKFATHPSTESKSYSYK